MEIGYGNSKKTATNHKNTGAMPLRLLHLTPTIFPSIKQTSASMTEPVKVFVSYSWRVEAQTCHVAELEKQCQERGIHLIRDSNTMKPGERISQFMDRIAGANHVIVILSEAYFKSKYCLYEWKELLQQKGLEQKIYPINIENIDFSDPSTRLSFVDFWQQQVEEKEKAIQSLGPGIAPDQHADLNRYHEFKIKIDHLMKQASDMLVITVDAIGGEHYAKILDLILPRYQIPPDALLKPHQTDQGFMTAIKSRIQEAFDASDTLRKAIASEIGAKGSNEASVNLTNTLLDQSKHRLDELLRDQIHNAVAVTLRRLSTGPDRAAAAIIQEAQQLTSHADALFSCLTLCAISDDWMSDYQAQRSRSASNLTHLPFNAAAAVEILTSRHLQRLPRYKLNSAKSEILGKEGVAALEDGFEKDDIVTGILRQIWVQVFPMDVKENLDEKRLRAQIKTRLKRKDLRKNNYYLIVPDDENHPLMNIDVQNELIHRLPELPVIVVKMDNGAGALVIPDDEELVSIILDFYLMLDEYIPYEPDKNR